MKLKQNSHYNRFILEIISPYTSYAKIFTVFYSCLLTELEVEASVENALTSCCCGEFLSPTDHVLPLDPGISTLEFGQGKPGVGEESRFILSHSCLF